MVTISSRTSLALSPSPASGSLAVIRRVSRSSGAALRLGFALGDHSVDGGIEAAELGANRVTPHGAADWVDHRHQIQQPKLNASLEKSSALPASAVRSGASEENMVSQMIWSVTAFIASATSISVPSCSDAQFLAHACTVDAITAVSPATLRGSNAGAMIFR